MGTRMRRIIAGSAALAAAPMIMLGIPTASADERAGTPDNGTAVIEFGGHVYGRVMWNDYEDSDHGHDLDDVWVKDRSGDGRSLRVSAANPQAGVTKTKHAYRGETEKIYLGNVPKGKAVLFTACGWNDNQEIDCGNGFFSE